MNYNLVLFPRLIPYMYSYMYKNLFILICTLVYQTYLFSFFFLSSKKDFMIFFHSFYFLLRSINLLILHIFLVLFLIFENIWPTYLYWNFLSYFCHFFNINDFFHKINSYCWQWWIQVMSAWAVPALPTSVVENLGLGLLALVGVGIKSIFFL